MKLDQREAVAVAALRNNPDFQVFLEYVAKVTQSNNELLIRMRDGNLNVQQGRTQILVDLIDQIEGAGELVEQYNQREQG